MRYHGATLLVVPALLCCLCWAGASLAGVGVYFDAHGYGSDTMALPYVPFHVYVMLVDSPVGSVDGVRVAYDVVGGNQSGPSLLRVAEDLYGATGTITGDAIAGEYELTWAEPRPVSYRLVLWSWTVMVTDFRPMVIYLAEASDSPFPDNLPEISSAGVSYPVPIEMSCWGYGIGSAVINENCPLPLERGSWGSVKAMFR